MNSSSRLMSFPKRVPWDLAAICLGALLLMTPGILGGFSLTKGGDLELVFSPPDEWRFGRNVLTHIRTSRVQRSDYYYGFSTQSLLLLRPLHFLTQGTLTVPWALLALRILNAFFALGLLCLVYRFSWCLFQDRMAARLAAAFLGASFLFTVNALFVTPVMSTAFWAYLCCFCAWQFARTDNVRYWLSACGAAGIAIASKFSFFLLVPLGLIAATKRKRPIHLLLGAAALAAAFIVFNQGYLPWEIKGVMHRLIPDNFGGREHTRWMNPPVYLLLLIAGTSVPFCVLVFLGAAGLHKTGFFRERSRALCLELPLGVYFLSICLMTAVFSRHVFPLVPYLALLAGHGASKAASRPGAGLALVTVALLYELVPTVWMEAKLFSDSRFEAVAWIEKARAAESRPWWLWDPGRGLRRELFPGLPSAESPDEAEWLVFTEQHTFRLRRSALTPLDDKPVRGQVYHWSHSPESNRLLQEIFSGNGPYQEVARFPNREITPELLVFKRFFGSYFPWMGDILIYRKASEWKPN